jgi:hypothetical protein
MGQTVIFKLLNGNLLQFSRLYQLLKLKAMRQRENPNCQYAQK